MNRGSLVAVVETAVLKIVLSRSEGLTAVLTLSNRSWKCLGRLLLDGQYSLQIFYLKYIHFKI